METEECNSGRNTGRNLLQNSMPVVTTGYGYYLENVQEHAKYFG